MEKNFKTLLYSAGVFPHYCGYNYFLQAVELAAEKPERLLNIRKEIYTPIAQRNGTEIQNVEKNIRTIRDIFMKNGGEEILADITGSQFWKNKNPYPRDLISAFASYQNQD